MDLYRVVRQGVRASVESYSLKRLEPLYGFRRAVDLDEVNERLMAFDVALEAGEAEHDDAGRAIIAGYNEDDCRSTLALRDWLEERRRDLAAHLGREVSRPPGEAPPERDTDPELLALRDALRQGVPEEDAARTPEQQARWLMSDLLEFHRRDAKPDWWRYFHLKELTEEELLREPDAIAGLTYLGDDGIQGRSTLCRYSFPPQEHRFARGSTAEDPRTESKWDIAGLDDGAGLLWLKRGHGRTDPHPTALIDPGPQVRTGEHRASIRALAERVARLGDAGWPRDAALDLLLRRRPNVGDGGSGPLRLPGETASDAGRRLALELRGSCLPIQGPPGTGKTHLAARQIVDLVGKGRRVGVTAMSHAVIRNLLDKVAEIAAEERVRVRIAQKPDDDEEWVSQAARDGGLVFKNNARLLNALKDGIADVAGGTTWVWAREDFRGAVDVLVVDEAGQMPLADVLACARAADSVILLGDPQQLKQPSQAAHPPGSGLSALEHVLADSATMPDDRGLFIERTRRMHPAICGFTSEVFYEGRLAPIDGLERQEILGPARFTGAGLRFVSVEHEGNSNASEEEAAAVAELVAELKGQRWVDARGDTRPIGADGILIVTPYNAQIRALREALADAEVGGVRVGTVDKFQGQQAPVVMYSMATSSQEEAPRGMEFLYDLHRLNVATSRAQVMTILVASPDLARVLCRTPRQMVLANALCRAIELAEVSP